jgi:hypothetical protein
VELGGQSLEGGGVGDLVPQRRLEELEGGEVGILQLKVFNDRGEV